MTIVLGIVLAVVLVLDPMTAVAFLVVGAGVTLLGLLLERIFRRNDRRQ